MSYRSVLEKWATGDFTGKFDRNQKTMVQVLAIGFLFLGELVSGKTVKLGISADVEAEKQYENRGSRVNFPVTMDMGDETESDGELGDGEPELEHRRGPGRPPRMPK